ncbi:family 78 glycoside hydrolase catalytic domain [Bacillaceae bacterium Marseille-Q3522]|nr:family 78 glycoside hydrolase catalytic domain [Bacillaceae bacterium Marseille-Q3522]
MEFPINFITASKTFAEIDRQVPVPYLRRTFQLNDIVKDSELTITGLGFYRVFINGKEITKGLLAPYVSNPDDIIYYDQYNVTEFLQIGENVLGVMLGNGMQNSIGGKSWFFDKARWRSAPITALRLDIETENGEKLAIESDEEFRSMSSPIIFDDFRYGEYYDARKEIPGWSDPRFDDSNWNSVFPVLPPRGVCKLCTADPIIKDHELKPVSIIPYNEGFLYDFGINTAGLYRLKISGEVGQEINMTFGEWYHDGVFDMRNIDFTFENRTEYMKWVQRDRYICKGEGEEIYIPSFTYHGFRYIYITGISEKQATKDLLTYLVMHSELKTVGNFSSSDEISNKLQECTRNSDTSNFYYFPTDCPQREKNGWTGDSALSAEQLLLNFSVETSLEEWMNNIRAAQNDEGALPGIVPTAGWGYEWGNGPAWDSVLIYIPFFTYKYRGNKKIIEDNATAILRYLNHLTTKQDNRGLIEFGLGDWCPAGRDFDAYKSPLVLTDSLISMDIAKKAAFMFSEIGWKLQAEFAERLAEQLRNAIRHYLIDFGTMTAEGACQTSQAMALYYGVFEEGEKQAAFKRLLEMIHEMDDHLDTGILGLRVLFHVLSDFGKANLAYHMITREDFPSYGNWIARGATSLWETFYPDDEVAASMNHHFFGDISSWFIQAVAGIRFNPYGTDLEEVIIAPNFIEKLTHAEAYYVAPSGKISVRWERVDEGVSLTVSVPETLKGIIRAPKHWKLPNELGTIPLSAGTYLLKK